MLFNYFNIYLLIVLRVPRAHATSAFTDLKVSVYGGCHEPTPRLRLQEKGVDLQEKGVDLQEKGVDLQEKGDSLQEKGDSLQEKECRFTG